MLLRARHVLPISSPPIEDGAVVVLGGVVADVGPHDEVRARHAGESVRDLGDAVLLPGLVNVHAHLELTTLRGRLDGLDFFPWIRRLVELKRGVEPEGFGLAARTGIEEAIRAGITTVADCADTPASFDALIGSGLRAIVFQEVFAPSPSWLPQALDALERRLDVMEARATPLVRAGISPHSTYMACDALLDAVARIAERRHVPLSIHLAESPAEDAFVRDGTGPIAELHRSRGFPVMASGRSPIERLAARGWLDLPAQLVHLASAREGDLDLIGAATRRGSAVGLAALPRSNAALGNGRPDLDGWIERGLSWGFGTDGAPAVGACDLFEELRFAARALGLDDWTLVRHATLDAAASLGLDDEVGSLATGKAADVCAIRLRPDSPSEPHAAVVASRPDDVLLTMVGGRILHATS